MMAFSSDPIMRWLWPEPHKYVWHFPALVRGFGGRAFENGTARGTLANGGGEFEQFYGLLSRHRGGGLIAVEFFELEDLDRARARFEELQTSEGG